MAVVEAKREAAVARMDGHVRGGGRVGVETWYVVMPEAEATVSGLTLRDA